MFMSDSETITHEPHPSMSAGARNAPNTHDRGKTRTLTLVGLMGAGKSTIGRRLAKLLGAPFYDADQEIVEAAGCSVSDIFEIYGETIFRDLEKRVMLRLLEIPGAVIAAGGGAFMNPDIRDKVRSNSTSIWLQADLATLVERVSIRNTRPLLERGDKGAILQRLMDERYPIYEQADLKVDSALGPHEMVADVIIGMLQEHWSKPNE
jgi:shikimate kinase